MEANLMSADVVIDCLQYNRWDRDLFQKTRDGGVDVVHVTVSYWEDLRETLINISRWHRHFINHADLILPIKTAADVAEAKRTGRLGIVFGFQNCSPINDDLGLVQILHELGARFMQLSYNNQSLLLCQSPARQPRAAASCHKRDSTLMATRNYRRNLSSGFRQHNKWRDVAIHGETVTVVRQQFLPPCDD